MNTKAGKGMALHPVAEESTSLSLDSLHSGHADGSRIKVEHKGDSDDSEDDEAGAVAIGAGPGAVKKKKKKRPKKKVSAMFPAGP